MLTKIEKLDNIDENKKYIIQFNTVQFESKLTKESNDKYVAHDNIRKSELRFSQFSLDTKSITVWEIN